MKQSKSIAPDRDARFMSKPAVDLEWTVYGWRVLPRPPKWLWLPYSEIIGALGWRDWLLIVACVTPWVVMVITVGL